MVEVDLSEFSVRNVFIETEKNILIWDTLSHPLDMRPLLSKIKGRKITIAYSHADWDHIWGTAAVTYENARIVGHCKCLERFQDDVPEKLYQKKTSEPGRWDAVKLIAPNMTFAEELTLDFGQETLAFHHLPGHTADSIVAFFPGEGILLMGDTVETPFPVVSDKGSLAQWISELQRWESDPRVKIVIPSHGHIGGTEIIKQNIAYLQKLLAGDEIIIPRILPKFYRETHKANIQAVKNE